MTHISLFLEGFGTWRASRDEGDIPRKGHEAGEGKDGLCAPRTHSDHVTAPMLISPSDSLSCLE